MSHLLDQVRRADQRLHAARAKERAAVLAARLARAQAITAARASHTLREIGTEALSGASRQHVRQMEKQGTGADHG